MGGRASLAPLDEGMRTTIKPQAHGGGLRAESVRMYSYSAATLNSKNVTASNSSGVLHDGRIAPLHPRVPKRHLHILPAPLSHAAATENLTLPKTGRELKHRAEFTAGAPNFPSATRPTTADARHKAKKRLHYRIWLCMTKTQDWNRWQRLFGDFHDLQLPYDEVSYTLLLWGYVLSHRHRSENAYMVLNAMKESDFVHGALLRANEGFLNCFFELGEVQARPQKTMWQNVVRMLVHAAQRFHRRRAKRTKEELLSLPGETLMALQPADVRRELLEDVRLSRIEAGNGVRLDELRLGDYAAADQVTLEEGGDRSTLLPPAIAMGDESCGPSTAEGAYGDIASNADEELNAYCGSHERADYLRALEVEDALDAELTEIISEVEAEEGTQTDAVDATSHLRAALTDSDK